MVESPSFWTPALGSAAAALELLGYRLAALGGLGVRAAAVETGGALHQERGRRDPAR